MISEYLKDQFDCKKYSSENSLIKEFEENNYMLIAVMTFLQILKLENVMI